MYMRRFKKDAAGRVDCGDLWEFLDVVMLVERRNIKKD